MRISDWSSDVCSSDLSAAAGTAALRILSETGACERANATAAELRERLNAVLKEQRVPWAFYGSFSLFHLFVQADRPVADPFAFDPLALPAVAVRSEESRVGEECVSTFRSRRSPHHYKTKKQ